MHVVNALDGLDFVDIFGSAMNHVHKEVLCFVHFLGAFITSNQNMVVVAVHEWYHFVLHLRERHFRQHFSIQSECSKDEVEALAVDSCDQKDPLAHRRVLRRTHVSLCVESLRLFLVQSLPLQRNLVASCQKLRHRQVAVLEFVEAEILNQALEGGHLSEFAPCFFVNRQPRGDKWLLKWLVKVCGHNRYLFGNVLRQDSL